MTACAGPVRPQALQPRSGGTTHAWTAVDDFVASRWAHDASGNHVDFIHEHASGDRPALLIARHRAGSRAQALLRREVQWNLDAVDRIALRVHHDADGGAWLRLGFRADGGQVFETEPQALAPGWNDLVFDLRSLDRDAPAWAAKRRAVNRLLIALLPDADLSAGSLRLERLLVDDARGLVRAAPTEILAVEEPPGRIERHALATWKARLRFHQQPDADAPNPPPLLRHMTGLAARVVAPDGQVFEQRGFCTGIAEDGSYDFALRLSPWISGTWRIQLMADGPGARSWAGATVLEVVDSSRPGPIRIDDHNPHYFATADGALYWPLGQNLAWAGDFEPWLDELQAAGGNWARVWLCAWGIDLSVDGRLERIDFRAAEELDRLFELAGERGIHIQLVLLHHGLLGWDWGRNPFNAANGGACLVPEDFWTDGRARAQFRAFADYLVARYGAYPHLMAWELWNEANLARHARDEDIIAWHRMMSGHLRRQDHHGHLITTSAHRPDHLRELFADRHIDFEPAHRYSHQALLTTQRLRAHRRRHKPRFLAEFGSEWRPELAIHDRDGIAMRQGLFAAWCQGLAGASMAWWWDVHNRDHDLLRHLAQLRSFIGAGDFRFEPPRLERLRVGGVATLLLAMQRDAAWGYLCDETRPAEPQAPPIRPLLSAGETLLLEGLIDGDYTLTWWTADGADAGRTVTVREGRLELRLPEVEDDLALRLLRIQPAPLRATVEEHTVGQRPR